MKYLNENGLQVVADKINTRLKTVTTMPLTANPGAVRLYVGEDTADYKKGHIYKYNSETYYCYIAEDGGYYYHFYIKEIEVGATVYACGSPEWFQKKADSISELTSDFSEIGYTFSITAASPSSITISNGGGSIIANRSSDDDLSDVGWTDISAGSGTVDLNFNPVSENAQSGIAVSQALNQFVNENTKLVWEPKTWSGLTDFNGEYVWTDGTDVYYSYSGNQYVLNKTTGEWVSKTWYGYTTTIGNRIWVSVNNNVYYSEASDQYKLNRETDTWEAVNWNGQDYFYGENVWTDGVNNYVSSGYESYILDESTLTWSSISWEDFPGMMFGNNVWNDGSNTYYSNGLQQYVFINNEWEPKTWQGMVSYSPIGLWSDGMNIYYSDGSSQYVLNKSTSTWEPKTWNLNISDGKYIWTDKEGIYYSENSTQYICHRE